MCQTTNNKMRFLCIIMLLCGCFFNTIAQDTIYIYEEVIVYDTIRVYEPKRVNPFSEMGDLRIIQIDTLTNNSNLLIITDGKGKSLPIDNIILTDNIKKTYSEDKEFSFRSVMKFAVKNLLVKETRFDLSVNMGRWSTICVPVLTLHHPVGNNEAGKTYSAGLYFTSDLMNNITLCMGINVGYLTYCSQYLSYLNCNRPNCEFCKLDSTCQLYNDCKIKWTERKEGLFGKDEAEANYTQISIPFQIGYRIGRFNPYIGLEYNYRFSDNIARNYRSIGVTTGIKFDLLARLSFTANGYWGLTNDMKTIGYVYGSTTDSNGFYNEVLIESHQYRWHTLSVNCGVQLRL